MKTMTCKELEGVCDSKITGNTPDEMAQNSQKHAMSVNNEAHRAKMQEMAKSSQDPEAVKKWMAEFKAKFDSLPEASK